MDLVIYRLNKSVEMPKFATEQSACFDLAFNPPENKTYTIYSINNKKMERAYGPGGTLYIEPGSRAMVPTGLIFDIPEGYSVRVHSRGGLPLKQGLTLANTEGVVDSDYVEETMVLVFNMSSVGITLKPGDRIAQAELVKDLKYGFTDTKIRPLPKTSRSGGFGSTGINNLPKEITDLLKAGNIPIVAN